MSFNENRQRIKDAIAKFPATFGLKQWSGTFRISEQASYINDSDEVILYTQTLSYDKQNEHWVDFAKGTEAELRREIVIHV